MLTKDNIKALKESLENTLIVLNDMLRQKSFDNLFLSKKDFQDQKIARKLIPEDYYKFRNFDTELTLRYNMKRKHYYIYVDSLEYNIFNNKNFYKTFENDFLKKDLEFEYKHIIINPEYSFDTVINIFLKVCSYYIKQKISSDLLFEVY